MPPRALRGVAIAASVAAMMVAASSAQARWFFAPEPAYTYWPGPNVRPVAPPQPMPMGRSSKRSKLIPGVQSVKLKESEKPPAGPLSIVVSIKEQRLTVYANGQPFARSPVSTGVPGHPTPQGVFSVIQKNLHHRSNLYSDAPMPYMQRITWSGVAMHEGKLPGRPASHGCIRLPREFAQRLWAWTRIGARVIIVQDDVTPADIAHARLFAPKAAEPAMSAVEPSKIRLATAGTVIDAPLKGTIDANDNARIENAIDGAVQAGMVAADAFAAHERGATRELDKGSPLAGTKDPMLRPGPISIYISRKTGRLYVRKGFDEVFEAPVTIAQPEEPLGTHIFSALKTETDALRWNVVSVPTDRLVKKGKYLETMHRGEKLRKELVAPVYETDPPGDADAALGRITIPDATRARIDALLSPGASLIISDLALSHETGRGTDFIVLTR